MDILRDVLDGVTSALSMLYDGLNQATNANAFITGLVFLGVCVFLFRASSAILTTIGIVVGAGALYTVLLSIDGMPGRTAFIVTAIAVTAGLFMSITTPNGHVGKILFGAAGGVVAVIVLLSAGSYVPQFEYGDALEQIISTTASFWREVASLMEPGVEELRDR